MWKQIVLIVASIGLISYSSSGDGIALSAKRNLISPPKDLKYFSLGYDESVSDSLWLRLIQDIDYCEVTDRQPIVIGASPLAKQTSSTGTTAGGWGTDSNGRCRDRGWVFSMLDAITTLTPRFRTPYSAGATVLSIVVRDYAGATVIYDRALKQFPKDWSLAYRAAFHYMSDLGDQKRAAELLIVAGDNGAPKWVYSLAAKLYTAEGQALLAKTMIENVLRQDVDPRFTKRLHERLAQANAVLKAQKSGGVPTAATSIDFDSVDHPDDSADKK